MISEKTFARIIHACVLSKLPQARTLNVVFDGSDCDALQTHIKKSSNSPYFVVALSRTELPIVQRGTFLEIMGEVASQFANDLDDVKNCTVDGHCVIVHHKRVIQHSHFCVSLAVY